MKSGNSVLSVAQVQNILASSLSHILPPIHSSTLTWPPESKHTSPTLLRHPPPSYHPLSAKSLQQTPNRSPHLNYSLFSRQQPGWFFKIQVRSFHSCAQKLSLVFQISFRVNARVLAMVWKCPCTICPSLSLASSPAALSFVTLLSSRWPPRSSSHTAGRLLPQDTPLLFPCLQNILTLDAHMAHSHLWLDFLMHRTVRPPMRTSKLQLLMPPPASLILFPLFFFPITFLPFHIVAILLFMCLLSVSSDQNVTSTKTGTFVCLVCCGARSTENSAGTEKVHKYCF